MSDQADIQQRKVDHIELCAREDVEFRLKSTLLEEVHLIHSSLPEIAVSDIDMSTSLAGKSLAAPIVISGMTGGAPRAREINRVLARVAEARQIAFGVGSQRAMVVRPETRDTYVIRDVAPNVVLFGNIGVVQAGEMSLAAVEDLVGAIGADALCIHLNPAQEMIQVDGDRDFRGCIETVGRIAEALSVPVIAKETGCGIAPSLVKRLGDLGVSTFDLSGAGGTTWVGVEALRARPGRREVGEQFWEWGIPTGAILRGLELGEVKGDFIASGGVRTGHDIARAIALGASAAGMALPFLRAVESGGFEAADAVVAELIDGIEVAMLLTGSRTLADLRLVPRLLGPTLEAWGKALAPR